MALIFRLMRYCAVVALAGAIAGALAIGIAYWLIAPRLPPVGTLKDVQLQVPLRVYSADGKLIAMFGETKRTPVLIEDVPAQLKQAFLAAEDADFYSHGGIDVAGIIRAVWLMVTTGSKHVPGGSTITQQVARNFFLSPEVSFTRKLSEIFLAMRIEHALTKDEILQLYLNKIFLGHRTYGVAAAAEYYYGKTLDQLTLPECAMLASLPKFPSTGNPVSNPARALERRNYVLARMLDNRFITRAVYDQALATPDDAFAHEPPVQVDAPYLAEMVRVEAQERLGNKALTDGYVVRTTIDSRRQQAANDAVRSALMAYDHRHGYRGPIAHVTLVPGASKDAWDRALAPYDPVGGLVPGLVTSADHDSALVYLVDGQAVPLDIGAVAWARKYIDEDRRGPAPKSVDDVLKAGDIVRLGRDAEGHWTLGQVPKAEGALVALDPQDGAVEAMVGGFSFLRSKFNRVLQATRGPGSSFKPFLYAAAFDHGYTAASIINDAPIVFPDPSKPNGLWTPKNDDDTFQGPMRLREALVKSVNLVSVRLLDAIGISYAREYITRFGFGLDQIPDNLSMALGTAAVTPMQMARAYAVFANGGFLVDPHVVSEIDDRNGNVVYRAVPAVACPTCPDTAAVTMPPPAPASPAPGASSPIIVASATAAPSPDPATAARHAPRVLDARTAYLITSMMRDVIRRGTGRGAMVLKRDDLAGKTGTTNDHRDAWFSGFDVKLVATAWVGFDDFSSLGRGEFGAKAALPMWIDFMRSALDGVPEQAFDMPPGISRARIDAQTGLLAPASDPNAILEVFKTEDIPRLEAQTAQQGAQGVDQTKAYDVF